MWAVGEDIDEIALSVFDKSYYGCSSHEKQVLIMARSAHLLDRADTDLDDMARRLYGLTYLDCDHFQQVDVIRQFANSVADTDEDDPAEDWTDEMDESLLAGYSGFQMDFGHGMYPPQKPNPARVLSELKERQERTPDFYKLRMHKLVPIFVVDMMKRGGGRASFIRGARYFGNAHTVQSSWRIFGSEKRKSDYVPLQFTDPDSKNVTASMRGELYGVSPEHILELDDFYKNGTAFNRIPLMVVAEEQTPISDKRYTWKNRAVISAYVYVGIKDYWKDAGLSALPRVSYHQEGIHECIRNKVFYDLDPKKGGWFAQFGR